MDRSKSLDSLHIRRPLLHRVCGRYHFHALWANGVRLLGRSFKYHRPRGIFSLANTDVNVLLEDETKTNIRGDVTPLSDNMDVKAVNTFGGLVKDRAKIVDRLANSCRLDFTIKLSIARDVGFPSSSKRCGVWQGLARSRHPAPISYSKGLRLLRRVSNRRRTSRTVGRNDYR